MGENDAEKELRILLPQTEIAIHRGDGWIPVIVKPFPLGTLLPKLAAVLEQRKGKDPLDWGKLNLEYILVDSLEVCCDLSKKEIENLTSGEKLGILKTAIFDLDPELPKNFLELANQVLSLTGGINI